MLDIKFIRENRELVEKATTDKGYNVDIAKLLDLDEKRRALTGKIDELRTKRNEIAAGAGGSKPSQQQIIAGKIIKDEIAQLELDQNQINTEFTALLKSVPNIFSDDTPIGDEDSYVVVREWGNHKSTAIDHLDFATKRGWLDFERGAKVAGTKFYYLIGELAQLQFALLQYGIAKLTKHGFTFMDVPYLVNERTMTGAGFAPRSDSQSDQYTIQNEDLELVATAEIPLTGFHADEIIDASDLPLLYAGYSPCFRREAGAAGKHTRGLFRVHQFNKLEMYVFCPPKQSAEIHDKILAIEEEIWQELNIPYRVINIPSGDLGAPAYKKFDIEYWSPADQIYRELTSCSNCTDYQARNLNIRMRNSDGRIEILHTLNGTALSMARTLVAIIENNQNPDGTINIPTILQPYLDNRKTL